MAVLADANGVHKSLVMKSKTIGEINRRQMCFMYALFLKWIVVGRHIFSYHRISTEEMSYLEAGGALRFRLEAEGKIVDFRLEIWELEN